MGFHFLLIIFGFTQILSVSTSTNLSIAKANCSDHCGNISIPYPFGTNDNCYHQPQFLVVCNETVNPPKLSLTHSGIEITNVSLDGQIQILNYIGYACYSNNGTLLRHYNPLGLQFSKFWVSNTANRFTSLGCDTRGWIYGQRNTEKSSSGYYETGCSAWCGGTEDLVEKSCGGLGCCQSTIPENVWQVNISLNSYSNYTRVSGFSCSYAFLVKDGAFTFHPDNLTNFKDVVSMPMIVDWAIDNVKCDVAKSNLSSYACISPNSTCFDSINGYGYRCQCSPGYEGNPYLTDGCNDIDECTDPTNHHNCTATEQCINSLGSFNCTCRNGYHDDETQTCIINGESPSYKLAAGISLGIILLLLVSCILYIEFIRRKSRKTKKKLYIQNGGALLEEKLNGGETSSRRAEIYSKTQLEKATNKFHDSMIIGRGGFGIVYKGVLEDNTIIAVKKAKQVDLSQIDQFINEVFVLFQINHRNVVKLLGCCLETSAPLLVYEFISNGTLFEHIHDERKKRFLDWNMRLRIAMETANVLAYLHSATSTQIIHRDVKSANILLDHNFVAKVSDFGASKLVPLDQTQLSTMVQGTFGYLDPEYMQSNQLTEKSDVYSFGVVLVELLTAKMVLGFERPEKDKNLVNFFLRVLKEKRIFEILDDSIVREENKEKLLEVAMLARECLNMKGEDRPTMKEVVMVLEGMKSSKRHPWAQISVVNVDESRSSLSEGSQGFDGYTLSTAYDSFNDHSALVPMSGGR